MKRIIDPINSYLILMEETNLLYQTPSTGREEREVIERIRHGTRCLKLLMSRFIQLAIIIFTW